MKKLALIALVSLLVSACGADDMGEAPAAEMVLIPAGRFMMGSPGNEGEWAEHPQHRVYVDGFYMDACEVTAGQYKEFLRAAGHRPLPDWAAALCSDDNRPIVGVNWDDAAAYARWAGKRLPTEAEWEYACRAGTTTRFNIGASISHGDANYSGTGGRDRWDEETAPVGRFAPNAWGLYDMHGNVWEWCSDWLEGAYYRNSPSQNPKGPATGHARVLRGGSMYYEADYLRSARRHYDDPSMPSDDIGFRCVKDAE